MNTTFCATQQQVTNQSSNGCFLLSHDEPVPTRTNYNSTEDVLKLLKLPDIEKFVTDKNRKIHIALCFKVDNFTPCDNSTNAQSYISLVTTLFQQYSNFLEENPTYNVEFVLDGAATAGGGRTCLADLWRPWNYTWIITSDPHLAFIDNSATNSYDRFQIMNTPINDYLNISFYFYFILHFSSTLLIQRLIGQIFL